MNMLKYRALYTKKFFKFLPTSLHLKICTNITLKKFKQTEQKHGLQNYNHAGA